MSVTVDSHVHVVSRDHARFPLSPPGVGSRWFEEHPVDADEFALASDAVGVGRAVLVQAVGAYGTDNSYVLHAAATAPDRFAAVVVHASDDDRLKVRIDECAAVPGFGGVRVFAIGDPAPNPLDHPGTRLIFTAARERGFPIVVATLPTGLGALADLLREFPDVPVALDHCGFAPLADLAPLASFERLQLKVTAHVLEARPGAVETLAERFGADRLLWGSDYPQLDDHPYDGLVRLGLAACRGLTEADRARVLGGNAARLWFPTQF